MNDQKFRRAAIGFAAVALVVGLATTARANHSWSIYHWARTSNPFNLVLGDNLTTSNWKSSLTTASNDWTQSTVLNTSVVTSNKSPRNCRPTSGRVEVCNAAYGSTGWLGIASIWASGGHITQGTVKLNDTYFNSATYNTSAWRNLVTCQEVGHTFGLGHQDEAFNNANLGTCMDYTNNPSTNQHPNQHDYDQLVTIYSHLDSTTTIANSTASAAHPPAMQNMDFSEPGTWGKLVATNNNGNGETYVQDFGNGHRVITHVFWAPGEKRGKPDQH